MERQRVLHLFVVHWYLLTFAARSAIAAPAPLAVLTDVRGQVQVVKGGRSTPGKSGIRLEAGDVVRVAQGNATVYYVARAPQVLKTGQQARVGLATAGGSTAGVWRNVYAGVATGFARRGQKRNAMVREDQRVQLLAPVATKIIDAHPFLLWTPPIVTDFLLDYRVVLKDAQGKELWATTTRASFLRYPAGAPALLSGRWYSWSVTPRQTSKTGRPELARELGSDSATFELAPAAIVVAARAEIAKVTVAIKTMPVTARRATTAAILVQRGLGAAAIETLLNENPPGAATFAPKFLALDKAVRTLDETSLVLLRDLFLSGKHETLLSRFDVLDKAGTSRAEFDRLDAARLATRPGTHERADASRAAQQAAADVAWAAFDVGQADEAARWFDRRASLRKDAYDARKSIFESEFAAGVIEIKKALAAYESAVAEDDKVTTTRRYEHLLSQQVMKASDLYILALQNHDPQTMLEYSSKQVELRYAQIDLYRREEVPLEWIQNKQADIAGALENRAGALEALGRFDEAERIYQEALAIRRELPPALVKRELSRPLSWLGNMYYSLGDMTRAREFQQQALTAHDESTPVVRKVDETETNPELKGLRMEGHAISRVMMLNNLGNIFSSLGDFKQAIAHYQEALKVLEPLPAHGHTGEVRASMQATTLGNIANTQMEASDIDVALRGLKDVVKLRRALGEEESAAYTLLSLGGLYYERGDKKEAQHYIEQARRLFIAAQDLSGMASASLTLSVLARLERRIPQAAHFARESLALAERTNNWISIGTANRALAAAHWEQKQYSEALALIDVAAAADARVGSPLYRASTLTWRGVVLEDMGKTDEALAAYREAILLREQVRETAPSPETFSDMKYNYQVYDAIIRLLIKMQRPDEAFEYLTRARSKRMYDSLRLSSLKTGDKDLQALLDRAGSLENKLRTVEAELQSERAKPADARDTNKIQSLQLVVADTQREFLLVSKRIRDANPNFDKILTVRPAELKQAQRSIPENTILVQYAPLGEQLYIFLVTRDALKIYTPPVKPAALENRIREFRSFIDIARREAASGKPITINDGKTAAPQVVALRTNLTALYAMLIAPIEPEIATKDVIAFIPTGSLYYLPIHALAKEQNGKLRFLIEDKQVVYLTAADVMAVVQEHDPSTLGQGLTAFGNPTGAQLQHALDEVNNIARVFPAAEVLSGAQVTKQRVLSPQNLNKRYLHFATHGVLNARVPEQSYIQLSPGAEPEDERLTVGEVYGLNLGKVDLVSLSACQTALGQRDPDGREITTLAEAFSTAGAGSVAASLWSVADNSTKELMVEFYAQLAAGKPKAAALQSAQLKVMRQPGYSHPFYWAPFVLMGNWR